MNNTQSLEKRLIVDLLRFFSQDSEVQQRQLWDYLAIVAERKQQAHVDDPLVELATGLEVWADRYKRWGSDKAAWPILDDISALLEIILRNDQSETASIQSLQAARHWSIVRRFSREALAHLDYSVSTHHSSVWDMLAQVAP